MTAALARITTMIVTLALAACGSPTEPAAEGSALVHETTVTTSTQWFAPHHYVGFRVDVEIVNTGTTTLFVDRCMVGLERRSGDEWRHVWGQACALLSQPALDIPPGGSLTLAIEVWSVLEGRDDPVWFGEEGGGEYRFRFHRTIGRRDDIVSNPFTVIVERGPGL